MDIEKQDSSTFSDKSDEKQSMGFINSEEEPMLGNSVLADQENLTSQRVVSIPYGKRIRSNATNNASFSSSKINEIGNNSVKNESIFMEEIVADTSDFIDDSEYRTWSGGMLEALRSRIQNKLDETPKKSKRIRKYYKAQTKLLTTFEDCLNDKLTLEDLALQVSRDRHMADVMAKITFAINLILCISKIVASVLSGSLSILSSLFDSALDLVSGIVIWYASRQIKHRDPYVYPQGRTRLEPVALIILSVIMALTSLQLIIRSTESIINQTIDPKIEIPTIIIICGTIGIKIALCILCYMYKNPSVRALAQDHRNDVLSNSVAIVCGKIGSLGGNWKYADPIGGIIISIYIIASWWFTGRDQIKLLTGHTAKPEFLQKITWICLNHHEKIQQIDTVRAFHFGNNFIVEVDIVLPHDMTLKEAHNIGEPLQQKLERLPDVERAFVHLDYEFSHNPNIEHKLV